MHSNRKNAFKPLIIAALLSGLAMSGVAFAHEGMGGGGYGPCTGGMMGDYGMMNGGMMGSGMMGGGMRGGGMGMMGDGYYGSPMSMMNLSDAQQKQIAEIQQKARKEQWNRMGEMRKAMEAYQSEMLKEEPDPDAASKTYQQAARVRGEMMKHGLETRQKMMSVMNKEQREQFRNMMGPGMGMMQ